MALYLSDGQLRKIRELQELLLCPLRYPEPDLWMAVVHEAADDLFGAGRSLFVLPDGSGGVRQDFHGLDGAAVGKLREALTGTRSGANRYADPVLDRAMHRLAASGVEVWNREIAERVSRIRLEEMPRFYPGVVRPHRLEGMLSLAHSLPKGRAQFHVLPGEEKGTRFGDREVEVFRLLLPSFRAGSRAYALSLLSWRLLRGTLDRLTEGVVVYRDGSEVYRNGALRRMLSTEGRREEVIAAAAVCAEELARAPVGPSAGMPDDSSTAVRTPTNRYHIAASHLEGGVGGVPVTVLVVVRPATPLLPDETELRDRYGLTPRQAEVALLLARGRSNREIAGRLGISRHTARHHAQRVLEKTGAGSRKALGLHFLRDGA